jgi:hypothetical protein
MGDGPIGDELPVPNDDVIERADRRELAFERFTRFEERHVQARFHPLEA